MQECKHNSFIGINYDVVLTTEADVPTNNDNKQHATKCGCCS